MESAFARMRFHLSTSAWTGSTRGRLLRLTGGACGQLAGGHRLPPCFLSLARAARGQGRHRRPCSQLRPPTATPNPPLDSRDGGRPAYGCHSCPRGRRRVGHHPRSKLHGTGIRVRRYGYGDMGKRHSLEIGIRGYGEYMYECIKKATKHKFLEDEKIDVYEVT